MSKDKLARMSVETHARLKEQKHRFRCESMASILAVAVKVLEGTSNAKSQG